jgi:hypothetical protein
VIERITLIKLEPQWATGEQRAALAQAATEKLGGLPGVVELRVGLPADEASQKSWDLSLTARFASLEQVQPYLDHPAHQGYLNHDLGPKLAVIKAWNFQ